MSGLNVEDSYNAFFEVLYKARDVFVPFKKPTNSNKRPWLRFVPGDLFRRRKILWSQYKYLRNSLGRGSNLAVQAWLSYSQANYQLKTAISDAVANYEYSLISCSDPRVFHSYVKSKKVDRPSVGPLLVDGVWSGNCKAMADVLVESFASVFNCDALPNPRPHQVCSSNFNFSKILPSQVHKALSKLKCSSTVGPDGLPSVLFKNCAL